MRAHLGANADARTEAKGMRNRALGSVARALAITALAMAAAAETLPVEEMYARDADHRRMSA